MTNPILKGNPSCSVSDDEKRRLVEVLEGGVARYLTVRDRMLILAWLKDLNRRVSAD